MILNEMTGVVPGETSTIAPLNDHLNDTRRIVQVNGCLQHFGLLHFISLAQVRPVRARGFHDSPHDLDKLTFGMKSHYGITYEKPENSCASSSEGSAVSQSA